MSVSSTLVRLEGFEPPTLGRFQDGVVARRQGFAVLWKFEAQMRPAYLVEAIYVQSGEFDR